MKTKRSFSAWILDVFAAVMVSLFPTFCVKKYTKKGDKNAKKFLPGAEKELKAIKKLRLSNEELSERVWSTETRVELIKKRNFTLVSDVNSSDEMEALFESHASSAKLVAALKVYTPSKQLLLRMLHTTAYKGTMVSVLKIFPDVVKELKAWEILGVKEDELYKGEYWDYAYALIGCKPKIWAVPFMHEVSKIAPAQRNAYAWNVFKQGFEVAFTLKLDLSSLIAMMSVLNPEMYQKICEHYTEYEDFSPYFKVIFPQFVEYLDKRVDDIEKANDSSFGADKKGPQCKEAFRWLAIGYHLVNNPRVFEVLLENIEMLKEKLSESAFKQLCCRMISELPEAGLVTSLFRYVPEELKSSLFEKMVNLTFDKDESGDLLAFFPFKTEDVECAKRAVRSLVNGKRFPVDRLSELSKDLQAYAVYMMEVASQIDMLIKTSGEARKKKLSKVQLHWEAEKHLLTNCGHQDVLVYNQHFKMEDEALKFFLANIDVNSIDDAKDIFTAYAESWKLSEKIYLLLMQSMIADIAPELKSFVDKGEMAEVAKSDNDDDAK